MAWRGLFPVASIALALFVAGTTAARAQSGVTTLEQYVYTPDPVFEYALQEVIAGPGFTTYVLLMNSLRWRDESEVDRQLWTHQLLVVVPDTVTSDTALFLINGGSDAFEPPDDDILLIGATLASVSGSVLAAVSQIPNQPLLFADEAAPISEDALVAYSWDKAMDTGEAGWAAYLPMTKASVRGMDAVQEFVNESVAGVQIEDFVVTGFSKRGATAWLVAAVDPRVRAVGPGVFDVLNMALQIERHYQAYGFYSSAIEDYVNYDIVGRVRSPEGRFLTRIVDPLNYAKMLELPKFLLIATGDQFFLPDSASFYVDRLPGETLIRQVPNTDHGFENGLLDGLESLLAWYRTTLDGTRRPSLRWWFDDTGALTVHSEPAAQSASLWQATNPTARDFRLETIGPVWEETELSPSAPGSFRVSVPEPSAGYTGYLVALKFETGSPEQTYGTPVFVTPDTLPFELDDPIAAPKSVKYWRCQLPEAIGGCPTPPDFTADELQALLPLPVFGRYVSDLDDLTKILSRTGGRRTRAMRTCMATRLNIASGELGWYSRVPRPGGEQPLWVVYAGAEKSFASGRPERAARDCAALNRSDGAAVNALR